LYAVVLKELL